MLPPSQAPAVSSLSAVTLIALQYSAAVNLHWHITAAMLILRWYLWLAPNALLTICLLLLLRRRRFPPRFFLLYLAFQIVDFVLALSVALFISRSPKIFAAYHVLQDITQLVAVVLEIVILYQIADELILSRSRSRFVLGKFLRWTMAVSIVGAAVVTASMPRHKLEMLAVIFQTLALSSSISCLSLMTVLLLFTRMLRVSWRSLPAGIVLGFAISACSELAGSALYSVLGRAGYVTIDLVRMGGFHAEALLWLIYVLLPEKPKPSNVLKPDEMSQWNEDLQKIVNR